MEIYLKSQRKKNNLKRRLKFAGLCKRSIDQVVSDLLWQPTDGKRSKERPNKTCKPSTYCMYSVCEDSNMTCEDVGNCRLDTNIWKAITNMYMGLSINKGSNWKIEMFRLSSWFMLNCTGPCLFVFLYDCFPWSVNIKNNLPQRFPLMVICLG